MRTRGARPTLRLLLAAALLVLTACSDDPTEPVVSTDAADPARRRVILIGIDGASPRLMTPMLDGGRMPNLAKIRDEGVYGTLRSEHPLFSPRVWNTIVTGKPPKQHGIKEFVYRDGDKKRLYQSEHRLVPAIWNILQHHGLSVGVVNWWTTFPPDRVDGVIVSDHFFPEQIENLKQSFELDDTGPASTVHPPEFVALAEAAAAESPAVAEDENPFRDSTPLPPWVDRPKHAQLVDVDARVTRVAEAVEAFASPDVTLVFLAGIDRASHSLWGNLEPDELYPEALRPNDRERAGGRQALEDYYAFTDALIGRLVAPFGPDDLVVVVSDHGFEGGELLGKFTGIHESEAAVDGVFFARGAGVPAGRSVALSIYDLVPTLLAWLDLPTARDMRGRVAAFLGEPSHAQLATYDGISIDRAIVESTGAEGEIVEQLQALGYLEREPTESSPPPRVERQVE